MKSSGTSCTCSVAGLYWISSNTSVWSTTEPGVSARLPPTSKRGVDVLLRQPRRRCEVGGEALRAADEVGAPSSTIALSTVGFDQREVRRRERVEHVAGGEARLALGLPVELGVGDHAVDRVGGRQVALEHSPQQPVLLPCRVAEAAVPLAGARSDRPTATREVVAQPGRAADDPVRAPGHAAGHARDRPWSDEAPRAVDRGIGQEDVERRARRRARSRPRHRGLLVDAVEDVGDADGLLQVRALEPERQVKRRAAGDPLDGVELRARTGSPTGSGAGKRSRSRP